MINESNDPTPAPKIQKGPEVVLAVGVDKKAGQVVIDFEARDCEKPVKIRLHLTEREVAELSRSLVGAALAIRGEGSEARQVVMIPTKDGVPIRPVRPALKFPTK